jgi:alpha-L-rhamnosidase
MIDAQTDNGLIPDIAPEYVPFEGGFRDSPEWGSAGVILPWQMYQWYGDRELLRRAYPMMKKYVVYLETKSSGLILSHGLGDWYDLGPKFPGEAQLTPLSLTATAMFYYDTKILSSAAGVLGFKDDAALYSSRANEIKKAFNKKFFNDKTKIYSTGSQTAMSMPLSLGLVEEQEKSAVINNLVKKIAEDNNSLTSGDIGYRYLLKALDEAGQSELIYRMNSRSDKPGYGYQLKNGATALTESWSALKDVSNDHMMLGHLLEWFYSGIGGIKQAPGSVAYNKVIINPQVVGDITHAETRINTVHGIISCDWRLEKNNIIMKIRIPVNCDALVTVPQVRPDFIFNNEVLINQSPVINISEVTRTCTVLSLSSGEYNIRAHYTKSK